MNIDLPPGRTDTQRLLDAAKEILELTQSIASSRGDAGLALLLSALPDDYLGEMLAVRAILSKALSDKTLAGAYYHTLQNVWFVLWSCANGTDPRRIRKNLARIEETKRDIKSWDAGTPIVLRAFTIEEIAVAIT